MLRSPQVAIKQATALTTSKYSAMDALHKHEHDTQTFKTDRDLRKMSKRLVLLTQRAHMRTGSIIRAYDTV